MARCIQCSEEDEEMDSQEVEMKSSLRMLIRLSPWVAGAQYDKSYLQSPVPCIIAMKPSQFHLFQDSDGLYRCVLEPNEELLKWARGIEKQVFFLPGIFTMRKFHIHLPVHDFKFYLKSNKPPLLFNEKREVVEHILPLRSMGKVKLLFQCISRDKSATNYHVFFCVEQMMLCSKPVESAW